MKKLLLPILFILFASVSSFAQTDSFSLDRENEQKCTELTREMVNELRLNELGYIKLKALNREYFVKTEEARQLAGSDLTQQAEQLKKIEADYESKLVALLDASQQQAYENYKRQTKHSFIAVLEQK